MAHSKQVYLPYNPTTAYWSVHIREKSMDLLAGEGHRRAWHIRVLDGDHGVITEMLF